MKFSYLFQSLVIDEARSIFRYFKLTLLDLLSKFPAK